MKATMPHLFHAATEVPGTFRVNGSSRRMRDLQAEFERPPRVRILSPIPCLPLSLLSYSYVSPLPLIKRSPISRIVRQIPRLETGIIHHS